MFGLLFSQYYALLIPPLVAACGGALAAFYHGFVQRLPGNLREEVEALAEHVVRDVLASVQSGLTHGTIKQVAVQKMQVILKDLHLKVSPQLVDSVIGGVISAVRKDVVTPASNAVNSGNTWLNDQPTKAVQLPALQQAQQVQQTYPNPQGLPIIPQ